MAVLLLALLSACTDSPAPVVESEALRSAPQAAEALDGALAPETDFTGSDGLVGVVSHSESGQRHAWSRRVPGALSTELVVAEAGQEHIVVSEGNPDRPALSPDGEWLAFVSAESGWASVYILPFDGGDAVQLTNRDLVAHEGDGMPPGWVAPPLAESLTFDGDTLVWDTPDGVEKVAWR